MARESLIPSLLNRDEGNSGGLGGGDQQLDAESLETLLLLEKIRRMQQGQGMTPQSFTNALTAMPQAFNAPGQQLGPFTLLPRGPSDFGAEAHLAQGILGMGNLMEAQRVNQQAGMMPQQGVPSPGPQPQPSQPSQPPAMGHMERYHPGSNLPPGFEYADDHPGMREMSPEFVEYLSRLLMNG